MLDMLSVLRDQAACIPLCVPHLDYASSLDWQDIIDFINLIAHARISRNC